MKRFLVSLISVLILSTQMAWADGTYYVVRHAEKQDGDNPVLTQKGVKRAAHIAGMLSGEPIKRIWSTDTNRTLQTATATAATKGLAVELWNTDHLAAFAEELKAQDGTFLIVAHSSSTPDLASALSGTNQPKLDESDYEKLFKVVIKDGEASIEVLKTTFE